MFGMKAKKIARKFKDSEPKVDDVKAPDVDVGESFRKADSEAPKAKKKQTFGEAFKAARARPTGSGSTFMYNGKSYHIGTKEEEATRPGGRGPLTRNGGSFPESKKNTPGGRGPQTRASTGPDSKKSDSPVTKAAKTASEFISSGGGPAAGAVAASRYMTRGGGSAPSGASGLGFFKDKRDDYNAKMKAYRESKGMKEPPKPNLLKNPGIKFRTAESINADRASEASRNAASDKARSDRQKAGDDSFGARVSADLEKYKYGKPGMKSGGSCGSGMKKYARGGGVESHGKTKGSMVKMASGGSVSARADGIASKGKTNCKVC
jgi:hypothetical protein